MKESIGGVDENDSDHSDDVVDDFIGCDENSVESEESNRSIESKLKVIVGRWCLRKIKLKEKRFSSHFSGHNAFFFPFSGQNCGGGG